MPLFPPLFVPKILIWLWPNSGFGASMDEKMAYNNFQKLNPNSFLDAKVFKSHAGPSRQSDLPLHLIDIQAIPVKK
jgi:hypothetical protein